MHFKILDTKRAWTLVQFTFFWSSRIPAILSTPFNSIVFNFSSDRSDLIFLLLNLGFIQSLVIYCFTSYFWCVIFQVRSRGGRMITSLNWISTHFESHCLGHLVPILCPCHLGHLITRGIMFPSFCFICWINWSTCITFLIWVCWTGIGTV